ncbi:MAG: hypothetical protein C5B50_26185 [Verrucomicrobia bacterium]|nr:MAG: hypothetical protein C5B50_26185 [Verrucomicrobiota bacterium]
MLFIIQHSFPFTTSRTSFDIKWEERVGALFQARQRTASRSLPGSALAGPACQEPVALAGRMR